MKDSSSLTVCALMGIETAASLKWLTTWMEERSSSPAEIPITQEFCSEVSAKKRS